MWAIVLLLPLQCLPIIVSAVAFDHTRLTVISPPSTTYCTFAAPDITGQVILVFCRNSRSPVLHKYTKNGTLISRNFWTADVEISTAFPTGVYDSSSGSIYIYGRATGTTFENQAIQGSRDAFITKFDGTGSKQWTLVWGSVGNDEALDAAIDPSTGYLFVTGRVDSTPMVTCISANGTFVWNKLISNAGSGYGQGIVVRNSRIYVGGYNFWAMFGTNGTQLYSEYTTGFEARGMVYDPVTDKIVTVGHVYGPFDGNQTFNAKKLFITFSDMETMARSNTMYWSGSGGDGDSELRKVAIDPFSLDMYVTGFTWDSVFAENRCSTCPGKDNILLKFNTSRSYPELTFQFGSPGVDEMLSLGMFGPAGDFASTGQYDGKGAFWIYKSPDSKTATEITTGSAGMTSGYVFYQTFEMKEATSSYSQQSGAAITKPPGTTNNGGGIITVYSDGLPVFFYYIGVAVFFTIVLCICGSYFKLRRSNLNIIKRTQSRNELLPTKMETTVTNITIKSNTDGQTTLPATTHELSIPSFLQKTPRVDYRIGKLIGKGGLSKIYLCNALDQDLLSRSEESDLVLKVVSEGSFSALRDLFRDAFFQELSLLWRFRDHANFAKVYGYSESPVALIMKLYPCGDFDSLIRNKSAHDFVYSKWLMIDLLRQYCVGLAYMHSCGVWNADVKPNNLLLEYQDGKVTALITDLGISRLVDLNYTPSVANFRFSDVRGMSIEFAAPEVIMWTRDKKYFKSDKLKLLATDVFSIAITILVAQTRRSLWGSKTVK